MILGDMFELGEESHTEHQALVDLVVHSGISLAYFVGPNFYACNQDSPSTRFFAAYDDFELFFKNTAFVDSMILIKGSRGMALERIVELL
jgi:UDP-N-acetylmuramoyl-tripeptide--D-alanyl-D-alanine ligase